MSNQTAALPRLSTALLLGTLALAGTLAAGCSTRAPAPVPAPNEPAVSAPIETVAAATSDSLHVASGTVRSRNTTLISPKVTGYLRKLRVQPGDQVTAGQLLAVLEATEVQTSVRRARAALAEAQAATRQSDSGVVAAESAASIAATNRNRSRTLQAAGAATQQQLDEAEARSKGAAAQQAMALATARAARTRVDQARAELALAETQVAHTRLVAPFAGRVIERRAELGTLLAAATAVYVVEQDGPLRVEAAVDESLSSRVRVGDPAQVTVGQAPPMAGRVGEIVPAVETGSRAFLVKVDLPASTSGLQSGMFARIALPIGRSKRLEVPAAAVSTFGQLDRVFVVEAGRARLRLVTLGETRGARVEVLSGLDPGEQILASIPAGARDGVPVGATR
jgi:RND family efflux transporter MFP subunit